MIRVNTLLLLVCLMTHWVTSTHAQIPLPPATAQTPNIASLGLFGQVPVSYFTGLPQIEIPLYTLQDKGIKIPVTLSYHASGFRPDAHPGWVGQGWNLSAGGAIYRTVNELQDEYNKANVSPYYVNAGYYFNHGVLNVSNWDQVSFMQSITRGDGVLKDTEPDEFSFSFPGGNGKFYMGADGEWKVKCDRPVKVTFNGQFLLPPFEVIPMTPMPNGGYIKAFSGFTITDTDGTQYVFGGSTNSIEFSTSFFEQGPDEWTANAWYLTKVIHADGYSVDLIYERDSYINQLYTSIYNDLGTSTVSNGAFLPKCSSTSISPMQYTGKLMAPVYLKTIQSSIGKISFSRSTSTELKFPQSAYDASYVNGGNQLSYFLTFLRFDDSAYPGCLNNLQWKKLDQVRIENEFGTMIKAYNFTYNNNANERLTLLSLTEQGRDLGSKAPYQFSYDNSQTLPPYLANKNDHWGFYNNQVANVNSADYQAYYNLREPNATYLRTGVLNKIIYPTGGVTEFTYEPHVYGKRLQFVRSAGIDPSFNTNTVAGGLRIAKIKSYDPAKPEQKTEKEYFYVTGYKNNIAVNTLPSSGVLGGQTKYYFDDYRVNAAGLSGVVYSKKIFTSQSVLPACNNAQGSHIGYSEVVEKDNNGGYTRYYFTNFENGHLDESTTTLQPTRTAYEPFTSLEEERGKTTKVETYNSSNVLINSKQIQYIAVNKTNEYVKSLKADRFVVCPENLGVYVEEGTAYRFYTYSYLPLQESNVAYDQNGQNPIATFKTFAYNEQTHQLKSEDHADSRGYHNVAYYRYPYDVLKYDGGTDPSTTATTPYMVKHNIIGRPTEVLETYTTSDDFSYEYVKKATVIRMSGPGNYVKPLSELLMKLPAQPLGASSYTYYNIIGIDGSEIEEVDPNIEQRSFLHYDAYGNVTEYNKDIKYTSYRWGYHGNYLIAKGDNSQPGYASGSNIAYTSFEETDKGDWTYSGTPVTDSWTPTGRYVYNLAAGNITRQGYPSLHFIVQYYKKTGATVNISGTISTRNIRTIGGWTLVEQEVSNASGLLTISGSGLIDELRLFPVGGKLETYTYDPLVGMTSRTDERGDITYYEYDEFQRLKSEKDVYGNILKRYDYQYQAPIQQ
ncbi:RHS repeat domain-containing protein [Chitinophaga filiformis]|uniref:YD repeat-containing protein n=1 Tax=Chitinophaga filiformis TaxID=104663 RepID=A0A1G7NU38_CHIFI|nr:hypothetical protein [Chitinophaga filiformis]SDF77552.1 hypothetical protein SAMN04488121_102941 [Chitinophaga filiformis]